MNGKCASCECVLMKWGKRKQHPVSHSTTKSIKIIKIWVSTELPGASEG